MSAPPSDAVLKVLATEAPNEWWHKLEQREMPQSAVFVALVVPGTDGHYIISADTRDRAIDRRAFYKGLQKAVEAVLEEME